MRFTIVNKGSKLLTDNYFVAFENFNSAKYVIDSNGNFNKFRVVDDDVYMECSLIKFKYRESIFIPNYVIQTNNLKVGDKVKGIPVEFSHNNGIKHIFSVGLGVVSKCSRRELYISMDATPRIYNYVKNYYKGQVRKKEYFKNSTIETNIEYVLGHMYDFNKETLNYFFSDTNYSIPKQVILNSVKERIKFLQAILLTNVLYSINNGITIKVNSSLFVNKFKDLIYSLGGVVKVEYKDKYYFISFTLPRNIMQLLSFDMLSYKFLEDEIVDIKNVGIESCSVIETKSKNIILNEFLVLEGE